LIGVGKELRRAVQSVRGIGGAGHGDDQGAGIEHEGELAFSEQGAELRAGGVESVFVAIAVERGVIAGDIVGKLQDIVGCAGQGDGEEAGADIGVAVVFGLNGRDHQVVGVIAARQKNANESLVIVDIALGHGRVHETQIADAGTDGDGADGGAGRLADEFAARSEDGYLFIFHKTISGW
jgi:hypothetical protein